MATLNKSSERWSDEDVSALLAIYSEDAKLADLAKSCRDEGKRARDDSFLDTIMAMDRRAMVSKENENLRAKEMHDERLLHSHKAQESDDQLLMVPGMTNGKTKWKVFLEVGSTLQGVSTFLFLGVACTLLMFYLMFTSLWLIPTLYFVWQVVDWHTPERGGRKTTFVRNWRAWDHLRDYFPSKLVKTAELNPNKNYIVGIHPHGIMGLGAFTCFSTESCGFKELFPGLRSNLLVLVGLFSLPLFREYGMFLGLLPVSKKSLTHLLTNRGKGNAAVILIGGAAESLFSAPGVNTVVMRQRKGFVRVALEFGADLVPAYAFGENDLFKQVVFSEGSLGRRLQDLFKKIMGFAPCLFVGEYIGILPYRIPLTTVVGSPISVPKHIKATEEEVDHFHKLYMEALSKLFHEHKISCGLSENHELRII